MNYYALRRDGLTPDQMPQQLFSAGRQYEQQAILMVLSGALNRSLNIFASCLQEIQVAQIQTQQEQKQVGGDICWQVVDESASQVLKPVENKAYITDQIQSVLQARQLTVPHQLMGNQNPTGNEPLNTAQQQFLNFQAKLKNKPKIIKRKGTEQAAVETHAEDNSPEDRGDRYSRPGLDEANLIETCKLPVSGLVLAELKRRREGLLTRRVDAWPVPQIASRRRRELRNLE